MLVTLVITGNINYVSYVSNRFTFLTIGFASSYPNLESWCPFLAAIRWIPWLKSLQFCDPFTVLEIYGYGRYKHSGDIIAFYMLEMPSGLMFWNALQTKSVCVFPEMKQRGLVSNFHIHVSWTAGYAGWAAPPSLPLKDGYRTQTGGVKRWRVGKLARNVIAWRSRPSVFGIRIKFLRETLDRVKGIRDKPCA
jgi:hypothetical protein